MKHAITSYIKQAFLLTILLGLNACQLEDESSTYPKDDNPESRSFLMGTTAFPYANTIEALNESVENAVFNGEIVLSHFDNGVPWNEALNDLEFPNDIKNSIELTKGHKTILTATATSTNRLDLADYWNDKGTHQELPEPWDTYSFDSPDVITAYIKYCSRLINEVNPIYFGFGIEINASFREDTEALNSYLNFADTVYTTLKKEYPNISIFQSFQDQSFDKTRPELYSVTKDLLQYSDIIAISTYPFWQYDFPKRDANPDLINDNWLAEMRALAPDKPFAISETGFCAENLELEEFGVSIKGSEVWQAEYLQRLFKQANELEAEFLIWFVFRDYDDLYLDTPNAPSIFKVWRDNGLLDGEGNPRFAFEFWDQWRYLPISG